MQSSQEITSIPPSSLRQPVSIDLSKRRNVQFIIWIIFIVALSVRLVGLGDYPARHATDDEFHYIWAGANFWDHGTPESWSQLREAGQMRLGEVQFDGNRMQIISPALDHPPLFSLIAGGFAIITGAEKLQSQTPEGKTVTVWDVDLGTVRYLMIGIFIATFWFLYSLASTVFSPGIALLSMLYYAMMSHGITHSRLVVIDNLSTLWLIISVWAVLRWFKGITSERRMAIAVVSMTALAVVTKVPAWCQVPVLMAMFFVARRPKQAFYVVVGFLLGISIYALWIQHYGFENFRLLMSSQAGRFRGFNSFQMLSGLPRLLEEFDLNGVIIAGWFCIFIQLMRPGAGPLTVVAPVYMLTFTFFAGDFLFGWYALPFFPWIALALGATTAQIWSRPVGPLMIGFLLLFLPHAFQTLYIARYDLEQQLRYGYAASFAGILMLFSLNKKTATKALRIVLIAVLSVVLMREFYEVIYQRADRISDREKYIR